MPASARSVFIEVAGHEYGHHVQEPSGIRAAGPVLLGDVLRLGFRCAGRGALDEAHADSARRGDHDGVLPDHGAPERNGAWFSRGGTVNRTSQCDTWPSPPEDVQ